MREKMSHGSDIIGLTLQLQKFSVGTPSHTRYENGNTVLGHYDHLLIKPVKHWLDFSPRMDWVYNEKFTNCTEQQYSLASHYPLKLLFPSQKIISSQRGFAYEEWKNPDTILETNPCLTVVLLNLTDSYRKQEGNQLLPNFLQLLYNNCQKQLEEVRCCVLPSLGYSDFCILMAGSGWKAALDLVDSIHGLTVTDSADHNKAVVVLSTDYMLPVCHQSSKETFPHYFGNLQLMVRVNLCAGITAQHLSNYLSKVQVYRTSGGSDCVLSAQNEEGRKQLMNFLLASDSGNFVVDIVSTPHLLMKPLGLDFGASEVTRPDPTYLDKFEEAIRAYSKKMREYNRHSRQINSLWELSFMIKNICSQPHTGKLRQIMKNLLESFSYCLNRCTEEIGSEWDFETMEDKVGQFSSVVGNFLSDLSRSDCFFMERDRYNHASVSSATSLLIAYNQWLNRFTHAVNQVTEKQNRSKYTFLVTSGGRDQTRTMEAFYFLDQKLDENGRLYEKVPLVTQMSEMSLFDFSGTILRATHECMHFSGIRRRPERVSYLLTFVCRLFSQLLSYVLLPESLYNYAKDILQSINAPKEVCDNAKDAYVNRWRILAEEIERTLKDLLTPQDLAKWNEFQCLSKNVQEQIYNRLMLAFSGQSLRKDGNISYIFHMNTFAKALYELTQTAQKDYFEDCKQLCCDYDLPCTIFSYGAKTQEVFIQQSKIDETLDTTIQLILSRLLIEEPAASMSMTKDECPDDYEWELNFPFFTLISSNVNSVLVSVVEIFKETFADVTACEILDADFVDYVLMHVFENWDLKSALSDDMANTYRIGAVLRLCYGHCLDNNGKLKEEACNNISEAILRLEMYGMPHRLDSNELCKGLNHILEIFHENEDIGTPLLEYLQLCRSDYSNETVKAALKPFADSYKSIRLLSIDPENPDCHEKLLDMYDTLIDRGERLS